MAYRCRKCDKPVETRVAYGERKCEHCFSREVEELFPIVAWATRVIEDRAQLHGDHDRDWLHE